MVGRQAAALGLPHATLTWASGESRAASLQARARAARYDLMAAYCHAHDIQALVTAHHLDDQAETFLMRLKRGSGLDGLAAIPERGAWAGIAVLRPLLDVQKARLVATLREADVRFVCDPSNHDPRFERARVRGSRDALSLLGLTPEALALSARRLRRAREALEDAARDFLAEHSETSEAGYAVIDTPALAAAPQEIALRALARLIGAVGGGETPLQLRQARVPALGLGGASRQGAYARPLPHRADVRPARRLPRGQRQRAARHEAFAGHAGTLGQSLSARASGRRARADRGQGARRVRLVRAQTALGTGRVAAEACRPHPAGLLARGDSLGTSKAWSEAQSSLARACVPRDLCQPCRGPRNGEPLNPLRKHAPLCVSFTWQRACMFLCYQGLASLLRLSLGRGCLAPVAAIGSSRQVST